MKNYISLFIFSIFILIGCTNYSNTLEKITKRVGKAKTEERIIALEEKFKKNYNILKKDTGNPYSANKERKLLKWRFDSTKYHRLKFLDSPSYYAREQEAEDLYQKAVLSMNNHDFEDAIKSFKTVRESFFETDHALLADSLGNLTENIHHDYLVFKNSAPQHFSEIIDEFNHYEKRNRSKLKKSSERPSTMGKMVVLHSIDIEVFRPIELDNCMEEMGNTYINKTKYVPHPEFNNYTITDTRCYKYSHFNRLIPPEMMAINFVEVEILTLIEYNFHIYGTYSLEEETGFAHTFYGSIYLIHVPSLRIVGQKKFEMKPPTEIQVYGNEPKHVIGKIEDSSFVDWIIELYKNES